MVMIVLLNVDLMCATALGTFFLTVFFLVPLRLGFAIHFLLTMIPASVLFGLRSFFLSGDRPSRSFSGTGVRIRSLSSYREVFPVSQTPVGSNIHEHFDMRGDLLAKITFNFGFNLEYLTNSRYLRFVELIRANSEINPCFL